MLEAKRGTIFDRHGEVIAEDIPSYTVAAILDPNMPQHVTDPEETARKLAPLLKMDVADVERILKKRRIKSSSVRTVAALAKRLSKKLRRYSFQALRLYAIQNDFIRTVRSHHTSSVMPKKMRKRKKLSEKWALKNSSMNS
ncbi:Penicillin-binding protein 2B [Anoxybacillus sp. BCO1]|nr:Penicillin-binding protein 2B [Anoxybacillus sp. BCO1]